MPTPIPSGAERAEARAQQARPVFAEIVRAPRHLALDFGFNGTLDGADPTTKGLYKLYGSSQPKDGGPVEQLAFRNMTRADLPGFVALVRECAVPLNKLAVTADFSGALVFDVAAAAAKSKNPDLAELHALSADKVAISFAAVSAILTNRDQISVPSTRYPGRRDTVAATDAQGQRLGRLGITPDAAAPVASNAPAGSAMRNLLRGLAPAAPIAPSLQEASAEAPF
jgi:hypothetical protein